jgi:hypothetical protein
LLSRFPWTYFNEPRFDGKKLVTDRVLQVNGIFFGVEIYAEIKDFFRNVRVGDEQQAVFQSGESPGSSGAFAMTVMGGAGTSGRSKP